MKKIEDWNKIYLRTSEQKQFREINLFYIPENINLNNKKLLFFHNNLPSQSMTTKQIVRRTRKTKNQKIQCELEAKTRTIYRPYYRLSDCISGATHLSTDARHQYYVEFNNTALTKDLIECCLLFMPSTMEFEPTKSLSNRRPVNFNKVFKFACKSYFLQAKIQREKPKFTQVLSLNISQFLNEDNYQKNGVTQIENYEEKLKKLLKECKEQVQNLLLQQQYKGRKFSRQQDKQKPQKQYKIYQISTIMEVQKKIIAETIDQIMSLPPQTKSDYIPKAFIQNQDQARNHLNKMLNEILSAQFVKTSLKEAKFKYFVQEEYDNYLNISYAILKKSTKRPYHPQTQPTGNIMIKRYTTSTKGEVLITLHDLVKMRSQGKNYDKEYFEIAKKLIYELKDHHFQTKTYYPLLNPQSILLNQLSLKVHLSYENILLQALGLLAKPKSIEQTICFQPTPQPFDSFASPFQYNTENRIKMFHFLYGSDKYTKTDPLSDIQSSKEKLMLLKQSELWRSLMTISFMMNEKKFYDVSFGNPHIRQNYQQFVRYVDKTLDNQPYFYKEILGESFMHLLKKQKTGEFPPFNRDLGPQFLQSLLNPDDNGFSILKTHQFTNVHKRINLYYNFFKELLQIIEQKFIFGRVHNSTKYLVRFYFNLYMNFSNILEICQFYKRKEFAKGIILQRELSLRLNLVQSAERKKGYVEQANDKFKQYEKRHKQSPTKYMTDLLSLFQEECQEMESMFNLYQKVIDNLTQLDIDKSQKDKKELLIFYENKIENLCEKMGSRLPRIKKYCNNIIAKSFIKLVNEKKEELDRANAQGLKAVQLPYVQAIQLKLKMITQILLLDQCVFETHFFTIQSIFAPVLFSEQPQGKTKKVEENIDLAKPNQTLQTLKYLSSMMSEIATQ